MFEHIKNLKFEEEPDYDYLRKLCKDLFDESGFVDDKVFDWTESNLKREASETALTETNPKCLPVDDSKSSSSSEEQGTIFTRNLLIGAIIVSHIWRSVSCWQSMQ